MVRLVQILGFEFRVIVTKIFFVIVTLLLAFIVGPLWLLADKLDVRDIFTVIDPREWDHIWDDSVEAMAGCRWIVKECSYSPWTEGSPLPPYVYYDSDTKGLCALFIEDAIMLNMIYGGTLKPLRLLTKI
jgi:hypothetical protein